MWALLKKLEGQLRFIAVLGASGTGKSWLVRAGLVLALHRGSLVSAGYIWNICIFKPGDAPLTDLAKALTEHPGWRDSDNRADAVASLSVSLAMSPLTGTESYRQKADASPGQALLLVVDQFEEIFRYRQKNVNEAESVINLLLRSAFEDVPIYVVMTMRSDFLGNCVSFFKLPEAINRGIYLMERSIGMSRRVSNVWRRAKPDRYGRNVRSRRSRFCGWLRNVNMRSHACCPNPSRLMREFQKSLKRYVKVWSGI